MSKISIIGYPDMLQGLQALGLEIHPVLTPHQALVILKDLANSKKFAMILITERLAIENIKEIEQMNERPEVNIVLVPDSHGSTGLIMDRFNALTKATTGAILS